MKSKKFLCVMTATMIAVAFNVNVLALSETNLGDAQPKGLFIKNCVDYEPDYTSTDYTYQYVGSVSGDNRTGSEPLVLQHVYNDSGTTTASIDGHSNSSIETDMVLAKMKSEIGIEVSISRSWTAGTSTGATYSVPPGKFQIMNVYIPATVTSGRLKYRVYMEGHPDQVFYEYKTLGTSYAPQTPSIHYQISNAND